VLFPIVIVMIMVGLLRHYATVIMKTNIKPDEKALKQKMLLQRTRYIRENAHFIPVSAFKSRKDMLVAPETGLLQQKVEMANPMANMMTDPSMMTDMMKKNMVMIIPNVVMLPWLSYFFSGFVIAKFPFPLTSRFRSMLQRDIELSTLDVTYVTSLSMYFLILFGQQGLFNLLLGEKNEIDDAQMLQSQMGGAPGGPGGPGQPGQDMAKIFKSEVDNLNLVEHDWALENVEQYLLAM
jgi:hypothetical protein